MKDLELPEENFIDSLIAGYLSGNASEDENSQLKVWLNQSEKNKQYFRSFCDIWQLSAGLHHASTEENANVINKILSDWDNSNNGAEEYRGKSRILTFVKYAASILLLIAIGYFTGKLTSGNITGSNNNTLAVVYAPMGSKAISVLPDGTQVWLNAGSRIVYNTRNYNISLREVVLTGEAYFKVKTNPDIPFVVNAKGINVKALGTEFNVKAYPEENQVVTTLVKGIVKIEGKDKNKNNFSLEMKPKQIVTLEAPVSSVASTAKWEKVSKPVVKGDDAVENEKKALEAPVLFDNVNINKYVSWKDNQWVLEGEEIGNLVVMLERKFNVKIDVASPELKNYKFTGTFRNETLEQVLSVLKIATPMKYAIGKGTVTLKIDPVLKAKYQRLIKE